ncbi:hypothetical protein [Pinibacter soli]|uniref:MG2 domain-containing protein n=1 Tax=Pinibacter soli TaxID=3044211 RepID=A0ABT6R9J6_9BACT|nr:hypothetical protein [Pinibacter soli]MDI3319222.1 hypothetical protein [Pinibacter soli]
MKIILAISLLLSFQLSIAQSKEPSAIIAHAFKYPPEKVFLQLQKTEYASGETVYFKGFVFFKFDFSKLSTNLYVECLGRNKEVIYKNAFPILNGTSHGNFDLPKDLSEDIYFIRAYTEWSLNFDERSQFIQPVKVFNAASAKRLASSPASWNAEAFPEGGKLVSDVASKIVVRLSSLSFLPTSWKGVLYETNDSSKVLANISSLNSEIGTCTFTPSARKNYRIKVTDDQDISHTISLPRVADNGVAISVQSLPQKIIYHVNLRGGGSLKDYRIFAYQGADEVYNAMISAPRQEVESAIKLDSSVKGLVNIVVFNDKDSAVAERLCFANLDLCKVQAPSIDYTHESTDSGQFSTLSIALDTTIKNNTVVEIIKSKIPVVDSANNMFGAFWLGGITSLPRNTLQLFADANSLQNTMLDNFLVCTSSWHFGWDKVPTGFIKFEHMPDTYLSYRGYAFRGGKALSNTAINMLIYNDKGAKQNIKTVTDSLGTFAIKAAYFYDSAKLYFNCIDPKIKDVKIVVKRYAPVNPYLRKLPEINYTLQDRTANNPGYVPAVISYQPAELLKGKDSAKGTLKEVVVTAKKRSPTEELNRTLSTPVFHEPSEIVFDFVNQDQDMGGGVMDFLNGRVPGLTVDGEEAIMRGRAVKVYIDEYEAQPGQLESLPLSSIAMVKVLRNAYLLGTSSAIAVYTKNASLFKDAPVKPNQDYVTIYGYPLLKEFNSKDQNGAFSFENKMPVLYWNPVLPSSDKNEKIRFYTGSVKDETKIYFFGLINNKPVYISRSVTE